MPGASTLHAVVLEMYRDEKQGHPLARFHYYLVTTRQLLSQDKGGRLKASAKLMLAAHAGPCIETCKSVWVCIHCRRLQCRAL